MVHPQPLQQQQLPFHLHPSERTQVPTAAAKAQATQTEYSLLTMTPSLRPAVSTKSKGNVDAWGKGGVQGLFCAAPRAPAALPEQLLWPSSPVHTFFSWGPE